MTRVEVGVVDVYVVDPAHHPWRVLTLQRRQQTRCPGSWEAIHGTIEHGETPEQAAIREVREETGLSVQRLYNVTVHAFYLHATTTVQLAVVFCAFVDSTQPVMLGDEHQAHEWLAPDAAAIRYTWPRATQILREITTLLREDNVGTVEDVLRIL